MAVVYFGLGSNLGDKEGNLRMAVRQLEEQVGRIVALSAFYVTAPWGFVSENSFLNAACGVETTLSPLHTILQTQGIERTMGRVEKSVGSVYADRIIDIDLLLYDNRVLSAVLPSGETLRIPHPLMTERDFVMRPLAEIAPEVVHPVLGKTIRELWQANND